MLFYLRNNLEADIPGAAGSTVGLTLGSCAPVLVSALQFGDLREDLRARRELFSFAVSRKINLLLGYYPSLRMALAK